MTRLSRPAIGFTVFGAIVLSSSIAANALTVGRCNALVDGVYVPVLVVKNGAEETIYQIGTDGLTRNIIFNPDAALDWAASVYGIAADAVDYSDACHKEGGEAEVAPPPSPVIEEEEEDEDDEDDYGGEGDLDLA